VNMILKTKKRLEDNLAINLNQWILMLFKNLNLHKINQKEILLNMRN